MKIDLLKGDVTVLVKKIKENNQKFKKNGKYSLWLILIGFVLTFLLSFFLYPSLNEAIPFIIKSFVLIVILDIVLLSFYYLSLKANNKNLIKEKFMDNKRFLENIYEVYSDEPEIRTIMEVLIVGCDMNYKEDRIRVKKIVKRLLKDI